MVDRRLIGKQGAPQTVQIRGDGIREFAKAVGETNPLYFDTEAAKRAGYPDIIAPPTYPIAFMAESMNADLFFELDLNIPSIVHAEQEFEYVRPVVAGESLSIQGRIADITEKQGRSGILDFVVMEADASDAKGAKVYTSRITLISKRVIAEEAS
jgi:acyl dehydratase